MEAINHLDALKPNSYGQREKIKWLSNLDGLIKKEIIDTHEDGEKVIFGGYTEADLMKNLIAPAPYDDIYIKWLEAKIDYANGEYQKYNNSALAFNEGYQRFARAYHREHRPKNTAEFTNFKEVVGCYFLT
jgi:hypothetical protein